MAKVKEEKEERLINKVFSKKELEELNLSPEDIEVFENAEAYSSAIQYLPETDEEIEKFFKKLDAYFPQNTPFDKIMDNYFELFQKDPEFVKQYLSMVMFYSFQDKVEPPTVEKISGNSIASERENMELDAIRKKLAK